MDCCGKANRIVKGTVGHVAETRFGIKTKKSPHTEARMQDCRECEFGTWMKVREYLAWLLRAGVKEPKKVTMLQLEKLPPLPKQDTGKNLYCTLCKCFAFGKARTDKEIEDMEDYEKCPKGFWKN